MTTERKGPVVVANENTTTTPTANNNNNNNNNKKEKEKLSPHTLRLIKLITNTSNDNKKNRDVIVTAIGLLTRIAKSQHTSYYQLWDILGRLQRSILSPSCVGNNKKNNKNNQIAASQAMKCIFACLSLHHPNNSNNKNNYDFFISHDNDYKEDQRSSSTTTNGPDDVKSSTDIQDHKNNDDSNNWLKVQDLLEPRKANTNDNDNATTMLDTILKQGYVLLSHEHNQDNYNDADYALHEFDSQLKQNSNNPNNNNNNNNNDDDQKKYYENFCQRRIELQRTILAKRLGLWIPPTSIAEIEQERNNNNNVTSFLTVQDFQYVPSSIKHRKRKQKKQQHHNDSKVHPPKKKPKTKKTIKKSNKPNPNESNNDKEEEEEEDDEEKRSDLEVVLLWQVQQEQQNGNNNNNIGEEPQKLLATEFLYRMLDPNWYIRYGAFLGILALLQAWWQDPSSNHKKTQFQFGVWLQDLLTRCLIVLSLDKFGDYSGAMLVPNHPNMNSNNFLNGSNNTASSSIILGSSVMAPVQEMAAQVIALLYQMAPSSIQNQCWNVLKAMISYHSNKMSSSLSPKTKLNQNNNYDNSDWNLRHGALLAFKYIAAILLSSSRNLKHNYRHVDEINKNDDCDTNTINKLHSIGTIAISSLQDSSHDVVAIAAQILNTLLVLTNTMEPKNISMIRNDNKNPKGSYSTNNVDTVQLVDRIKCEAWKPIWNVLKTLDPCYPCCVDVLSTLSILLQQQQQQQPNDNDEKDSYNKSIMIHEDWSWLLNKLLELLITHHVTSVQISCLQALTCIIPTILRIYNFLPNIQTTNILPSTAYQQHKQQTILSNNDNNIIIPDHSSSHSDNSIIHIATQKNNYSREEELNILYNTMSSLVQHLFEFYWDDRNSYTMTSIQTIISNLGNDKNYDHNYDSLLSTPKESCRSDDNRSQILSSYQNARNQAWFTIIEALSNLITMHTPQNPMNMSQEQHEDESLILYDTILQLLLRLVNIKEFPTQQERTQISKWNDTSTTNLSTTDTMLWIETNNEDAIYKYYYGLLEEKLPKQYSQTLLASHAFARLVLLACRDNNRVANVLVSFVSVAIQCMLQSPWPTICETGCLLLHCIMMEEQKSRCLMKNLPSSQLQLWKYILIDNCLSILENAIVQSPNCFQPSNSQTSQPKKDNFSSWIKSSNDKFVATLKRSMRYVFYRENNHNNVIAVEERIQQYVQTILSSWKENQNNYSSLTLPSTPSLSSMRLSASLATAMISLGHLPSTKLTPLIRSLMTSLKNETCQIRSQTTYHSIVKLLQMLHLSSSPNDIHIIDIGETTQQQQQQHLRNARIREKILENICAMGCVAFDYNNNSSVRGYTKAGCKGSQKVIQLIIQDLLSSSSFSIIDNQPIWKRLQPLVGLDPAASGEENLLQSLVLFSIISSALLKSSSSIPMLHQNPNNMLSLLVQLLPTTTLVACASTLSLTRQKAVISISNISKINPVQAIPNILPTLFQYLRDIENDSGRLGGCSLLHSLVDGLGVSICPFVRFLLPIVMSMMTDTVKDCAMISASTFASLVRVAPLVQMEECDDNDENVIAQWDKETQKRMMEECQIGASDKVINHLIHGQPLPPCVLPQDVDKALKSAGVTLRDYQKEGISWIIFLQTVRLSGALCDDMGLGKTLQSLVGVAIAHSQLCSSAPTRKKTKSRYYKEKSLVVCPSTLVRHWVKEIEKFFPTSSDNPHSCFKAMAYDGNKKQRNLKWEKELDKCNIVVTSYPVLRNDIENLKKITWVYCILDEGHLLKNPKTATAKAARILRSQYKLILTGTPVQNKVNELWAVFDFLMPNYLGSENEFTQNYSKIIEKGQLPGASSDSLRKSINKLKLLHQQVLPFILRREKGQIMKELPPKTIIDIPCVMSEQQLDLYRQFCKGREGRRALELLQGILDSRRNNLESHAGIKIQDTISSQLISKEEDALGHEVLRSLFYLRLLCTHPILVASSRNKNKIINPSLVNTKVNDETEHKDHDSLMELKDDGSSNDNNVLLLSSLECSGKMLVLNDLMRSAGIFHDEITAADNDESLLYINDFGKQEVSTSYDSMNYYNSDGEENNNDNFLGLMDPENGETSQDLSSGEMKSKCLIFAQFTHSLDVVEEFLFRPHMSSLKYLRLDGRVPAESRADIVDRFNEDDDIRCLLLTTKVGGLGLNLTGADTVILLEHDWNPYADLQAMDRAHRIGQTKAVHVYRLVTSDSIEEKIMELQRIKMDMCDAIVNSENSTIYSMGTDRLLDLFTFEDPNKLEDGKKDQGEKSLETKSGISLTSAIDDLWCEDEYSKLSVSEFLNGLIIPSQTLSSTEIRNKK